MALELPILNQLSIRDASIEQDPSFINSQERESSAREPEFLLLRAEPPAVGSENGSGTSPEIKEYPITDQHVLEVDLPPCCLQFVPETLSGRVAEYIVVGTYYLGKEEAGDSDAPENTIQSESAKIDQTVSPDLEDLPKEPNQEPAVQTRSGSLLLCRIRADEIHLVQTVPYPSGAILDLHFFPGAYHPRMFAIATSTGTISFYEVVEKEEWLSPRARKKEVKSRYEIMHVATHQCFFNDILITSFTWCEYDAPRRARMRPVISVTTSSGAVHLISFDLKLTKFQFVFSRVPVIQHSDRAWCSVLPCKPALDCNSTEEIPLNMSSRAPFLYSGGDDFYLRRTPLPFTDKFPLAEVFYESPDVSSRFPKIHSYGVTAILPISLRLLLTGSYDEHIRLLCFPAHLSKPKVLFEYRVEGGGVWRLSHVSPPIIVHKAKTLTQEKQEAEVEIKVMILASCMQAGCRVIEISGNITHGVWKWEGGVNLVAGAKGRMGTEICYASDIQPPLEKSVFGKTAIEEKWEEWDHEEEEKEWEEERLKGYRGSKEDFELEEKINAFARLHQKRHEDWLKKKAEEAKAQEERISGGSSVEKTGVETPKAEETVEGRLVVGSVFYEKKLFCFRY